MPECPNARLLGQRDPAAPGPERRRSGVRPRLGDEGRAFLLAPFANDADGQLDARQQMLAHRHTVPVLGYDATTVAGMPTYRDGEATGALPGRLLHSPQAFSALR